MDSIDRIHDMMIQHLLRLVDGWKDIADKAIKERDELRAKQSVCFDQTAEIQRLNQLCKLRLDENLKLHADNNELREELLQLRKHTRLLSAEAISSSKCLTDRKEAMRMAVRVVLHELLATADNLISGDKRDVESVKRWAQNKLDKL
jgi:hypothetical protein